MRSALTISRLLAVPSACVALTICPSAAAQSQRPQRAAQAARGQSRQAVPGTQVTRLARAHQEATERLPQAAPVDEGTLPQDPSLDPLLHRIMSEPLSEVERKSRVTPGVLDNLSKITLNFERGRALLELAREASKSSDLQELLLAHRAMERASESAISERDPLRHDQLLMSVIQETEPLTDALVRESFGYAPAAEAAQPQPFPGLEDVTTLSRLARLEWRRAAFLANRIHNPTYRSESLSRVAEAMGRDSAQLMESLRRNESPSERLPDSRVLKPEESQAMRKLAEEFMFDAAGFANQIERPIWRNSALDRIAITAGESGQFATGAKIARKIGNAEARAQALILVAESECRKGLNQEATSAYADAAEAVSHIERSGLRGVLTGYLVDSLISTGRFDDARACLVLYPTETERFGAMGAIAESQGRRGLADAARVWISTEAPELYRSALYRRVNTGVLATISNERQNRTRTNVPRINLD